MLLTGMDWLISMHLCVFRVNWQALLTSNVLLTVMDWLTSVQCTLCTCTVHLRVVLAGKRVFVR